MDEYKQWVMNEMSQMPVSAWVRSTYSSGATVIKTINPSALKEVEVCELL